MSAIENIIAQMRKKTHEELTTFEKEEKEKIDQEFNKNLVNDTERFQQQEEKQKERVRSKYRQLRNRQKVENRQQKLNQKQQLLNRLFEEAIVEMENWDTQVVQNFAKQVLPEVPINAAAQIIIGEKSRTQFSQDFLQDLAIEIPWKLEVSVEVIPGQAGFLIDCQGVQYNFLFSSLIRDVQESASYEMAEQLFG